VYPAVLLRKPISAAINLLSSVLNVHATIFRYSFELINSYYIVIAFQIVILFSNYKYATQFCES
jgi:hypothetical protein